MPTHYLACDLGADSGRLILGTLEDGKIALEELHRFPTGATKVAGALHWEFDRLLNELKTGLKQAGARKLPIASISTDSWGVDYVLYDERGLPLSPVWCYRDSRTAQGVEIVKEKLEWPIIFAETGIQFMALNTIYQIATEPPARLARAKHILLIGDAFNFFCSGVARNEVSLASTTQLYNPTHKRWSKKLFAALGLREDLFAPICPGGTRLGPLKKNLATETGLPQIEVIAVLLARHRRGGGGGARGRGELGVLEFGHLVADGRRMSATGHQRPEPQPRLHQRNRLWRFRAAAQKHRRPLAPSGIAPALGQGRQKTGIRRTRKTRRGNPRRSYRSSIPTTRAF